MKIYATSLIRAKTNPSRVNIYNVANITGGANLPIFTVFIEVICYFVDNPIFVVLTLTLTTSILPDYK